MSDKVNAKLYKLQDSLIPIYGGTESLINTVVELYKDKTNHDFKNIPLREDINQIMTVDEEGNNYFYNAKLYVLNTKEKTPDWVDFAYTITEDNTALEKFKNKYSSFLLFVYDENSVFAISKGYYGHHLLGEHIDIFFGIEILSKANILSGLYKYLTKPKKAPDFSVEYPIVVQIPALYILP